MSATQWTFSMLGLTSGGGLMGAHAVTGSATTKKPTKPSSGRPEPNLAGRSSYIRNGLRFLVVSTITSPITRLGAREARSKPSLMFKLSLIVIWVKISLHSDHLGRRCRQGDRNCVTCNAPSCDLKILKISFFGVENHPQYHSFFSPSLFFAFLCSLSWSSLLNASRSAPLTLFSCSCIFILFASLCADSLFFFFSCSMWAAFSWSWWLAIAIVRAMQSLLYILAVKIIEKNAFLGQANKQTTQWIFPIVWIIFSCKTEDELRHQISWRAALTMF